MMAASKKKSKTPKKSGKPNPSEPLPVPVKNANCGDTEEESIHEEDVDAKMADADSDSADNIPDIIDNNSHRMDDENCGQETKKAVAPDKPKKSKKENVEKDSIDNIIPFMDTFYQLSSEDSPRDRSIAAKDLISHCFYAGSASMKAINHKDAAYALTRLMNGLCTGRAASRQGFASCLSTFLRVVYSPAFNGDGSKFGSALNEILQEDPYAQRLNDKTDPSTDDLDLATIVRKKLLSTTEFLHVEGNDSSKSKGGKKMKGMEERDHAFGRLFGILAIVRSGILGIEKFPPTVVEGYVRDLIDLYQYKKWMREPAAHAMIELVSSLGSYARMTKIANDVIIPNLLLSTSTDDDGAPIEVDASDRTKWMQQLTAEQIAVAVNLQMHQHQNNSYDSPLHEPLLTAKTVCTLAAALAATSNVVHPRCHVVWNAIWTYLTEEVQSVDKAGAPLAKEGKTILAQSMMTHRILNSTENELIIEKIIHHVVVVLLLGKGEESISPTHERRSLALQIIQTLTGSKKMNIVIPSSLIDSVLCPEVVEGVFLNVMCASGGLTKRKAKSMGAGNDGPGVEHYLKPLTSAALLSLSDHSGGDDLVTRRMAIAKALLTAEARFDSLTKTQTVSSILMLERNVGEILQESEKQQVCELWGSYVTFLEEQVIKAKNLHSATSYIELMYKFAKKDLSTAPAAHARRVARFFMSGSFFDCSSLNSPQADRKTIPKNKKRGKKHDATRATEQSHTPPELSSGFRIKDLLSASDQKSIPQPVRSLMSARFFSIMSDFISTINTQHRGRMTNQFYKGDKSQAVYRALSEVCGICSLLESSGAKAFHYTSEDENEEEHENPMDASGRLLRQVQNFADETLVRECTSSNSNGDMRSQSSFATGCASLLMSLSLQLYTCIKCDQPDKDEEDNTDEDYETIHEYISDLGEIVTEFKHVISNASKIELNDDRENPMALMATLVVNILSSPIGGEDLGNKNPVQASASKLTREVIKMAWSGALSLITELSEHGHASAKLVDEDVMITVIESVCGLPSGAGPDSNAEEDGESDEESAVFVEASNIDMHLDDSKENDSVSAQSDKDIDVEDGVELDPSQLENMLLEDSDVELGESGQLEHHEGADAALAQLIKLKKDAKKEAQSQREQVELRNRLRCAMLLDSLFSATVLKSNVLPVEAVLGSLVPILRARKVISKNIQATSDSTLAKRSLSDKNALLDRLSSIVKEKISKYRCKDESLSSDASLKASAQIYEELSHSLNAADCSCCSIALITALRCVPDVEGSDQVKEIYAEAVKDWSKKKATKIHSCVFDDLVLRMPSLAAVVLIEPLCNAVHESSASFIKSESIRVLSLIYKHGTVKPQDDAEHNAEHSLSQRAISAMKDNSNKVAFLLTEVLNNKGMKAKHRDAVLNATKLFIQYVKRNEAVSMGSSELIPLKEALESVVKESKGVGTKQLCEQVVEIIAEMLKSGGVDSTTKTVKKGKTPKKSIKKAKK